MTDETQPSRGKLTEGERLEFEISQYLDGQLPRRRALALERRLRTDVALAETFRRYAAMEGRLSALGAAELAGVDYDEQRGQIMAALERKVLLAPPSRVWRLRPVLGAIAAAAAAVIAVTVGWWALGPGGPQPVVQAIILPAGPQPLGEVAMVVRYPRLEADELTLALDGEVRGASALPPGTVAVSFGSRDEPGNGAGEDLSIFMN